MSGFSTDLQSASGCRLSRASKQSADLSLCCARGRSSDARIETAWSTLLAISQSTDAQSVHRSRSESAGRAASPTAQSNKRLPARVLHSSQISGVYLRVAVETAKLLVHDGTVEVHRQAVRKCIWQPLPSAMEHVKVILQANQLKAGKISRSYHAGHDPPAFFFGRKASDNTIVPVRIEPSPVSPLQRIAFGFFPSCSGQSTYPPLTWPGYSSGTVSASGASRR